MHESTDFEDERALGSVFLFYSDLLDTLILENLYKTGGCVILAIGRKKLRHSLSHLLPAGKSKQHLDYIVVGNHLQELAKLVFFFVRFL